jgi:hypothetical protein
VLREIGSYRAQGFVRTRRLAELAACKGPKFEVETPAQPEIAWVGPLSRESMYLTSPGRARAVYRVR